MGLNGNFPTILMTNQIKNTKTLVKRAYQG